MHRTTRLFRLAVIVLTASWLSSQVSAEPPDTSPVPRQLAPEQQRRVDELTRPIEGLKAQGQFAQAAGPALEIVAIVEEALGPGHWQTGDARRRVETLKRIAGLPEEGRKAMSSVGALGGQFSVSMQMARHAEAEPIIHELVALHEKWLGADHPDTLAARNSLAVACRALGRNAEAIRLFETTLKSRESKLGPDHPDTLTTRNNLAASYWSIGRLDLSVPLFEQGFDRQRSKLGPDHPDTLLTQVNLGVNYRDAGRPAEGARLMEDALRRAAGRPELLERVAWSLPQLADAYDLFSQFSRSEPLYRDALVQAVKSFGPHNPNTAGVMALLGLNLLRQEKWSEAESVLRECLATREQIQPNVWSTFNTRSLLGGALLGMSRYAEAEPLVIAGYAGMKTREATIPPQGRVRLTEAAVRVVKLYERWGKSDQAAAWKKKLGLTDLPRDVFAPP